MKINFLNQNATNIRTQAISFLLLLAFVTFSFEINLSEASPVAATTPDASFDFSAEKEMLAESVGTQAYLFGASIMTQMYFRNKMLKMVEISQNPKSPIKLSEAAADGLHYNELIHTLNLTNHLMKIGGTPNVDTRYSIIIFNLEYGAQVLEVPPIKDRYFSINIADAYLGNKPYICSRKGDVNGGKYLFTGPDWKGTAPPAMKEYKMPQNNFFIVFRIYVKDPQTDEDNVTEIQNQFSLNSLDRYQGKIKTENLIPIEPIKINKGVAYFKQMIGFMKANPPEGCQNFIWNMFRQAGVGLDGSFDPDSLDEPTRRGLEKGLENGEKIIQWRARQRPLFTKSGWNYSLTMGDDVDDYMHRSEWAKKGLIVGSPAEALFFLTFTDGERNKLDGSNKYTIHIPADKMPPVNAFWSITSYGADFNVLPNKYFHYGVGQRNKQMKYNDDGSLTFKLQPEKPEEGLWNWIPTPESGNFSLNFRFYNPKQVLFDNADEYLPPVEKVISK